MGRFTDPRTRVNPGILGRKRASIFAPYLAPDAQGDRTQPTWVLFRANQPIELDQTLENSGDVEHSNKDHHQTGARLLLRYFEGLTDAWKLVIDRDTWDILFVNEVPPKKRWLVIAKRNSVPLNVFTRQTETEQPRITEAGQPRGI